MKKFKGFNVPDIGEFVSDEKKLIDCKKDYCKYSDVFDCCCYGCEDCLFDYEKYYNDIEFIEWHQQRKAGKKLEK